MKDLHWDEWKAAWLVVAMVDPKDADSVDSTVQSMAAMTAYLTVVSKAVLMVAQTV